MKRFFRLIVIGTIVSLLVSIVGAAQDESKIDVPALSTTRINEWLVNYHFTTEKQVQDGVKGGDSAQNTFAYTICPTQDNIHLLATNTTGIYRSEDDGRSWITSGEGLEQNGANTLLFHPDLPNVVYATVFCGNNSIKNPIGDGIYISKDYGKTWRMTLQKFYYSQTRGSDNIAFGEKNGDGNRVIYASTYRDGVYKSEDHGETWELLWNEDKILRGIRYHAGIISVWGDQGTGLYQSTDGGLSFEKKEQGLPDDNAVYCLDVNPSRNAHVICVAGLEAVLYESFDGGNTWALIPSDFGTRDEGSQLRSVKFGPVCEDGSVNLYISIRQAQFNIRHSTDYGRTFSTPKLDTANAITGGLTGWFEDAYCPHPNKPNVIMGTFNCFIFRSEDFGENYEFSSSGFSGYVMQSIKFIENGTDTLAYIGLTDRGMGRLIKGYDDDYPPFSQMPVAGYESQASCNNFAVNPDNPNHVIYVTGHTGYDAKTCFAETKDGFETSRLIEETGGKGYSKVFWHPQKTNIIYAGAYVSYDTGATWNEIEHIVYGMSPNDGDVICGGSPGANRMTDLYISLNRGETWLPLNLSVYDMRNLAADLYDPYVFWIGSRGLHRIDCYNGTVNFYGNEKGFPIFSGRVMQITNFAQDPNCREHLILTGRDSVGNTLIQCTYESWDYGASWAVIDGLPVFANGSSIMFHPSKPYLYFGTGLGTMVYEFENYKKYHTPKKDGN